MYVACPTYTNLEFPNLIYFIVPSLRMYYMRRAIGQYIQVYNTFIPNIIVIKTEKSMIFDGVQRGRFAQSIDIDGGKR